MHRLQRLRGGLHVSQRNAFCREGHQRGTAAGNDTEHQIARRDLIEQGGEIARGGHRLFIGYRMTGFVHAQWIGQLSIDVVILRDDHAAAQAIVQDFADRFGHGHSGFARTDQIDVIEVTQRVRLLPDQDAIADTRDKAIHRFGRIDGGQCGTLQLMGDSAQIELGHVYLFPGFTVSAAV